MKKLIISLSIALGLFAPAVALPGTAMATDVFQVCSSNASGTDVCKDAKGSNTNPFTSTLKVVINILSIIVGIAAVIALIIGGIYFISAQGDAAGVKNARNTVIYAMVGLIVAGLAQAIVAFVLNKL
jgi:hypothetical protein